MNVSLRVGAASTELLHDHLLLGDGGTPSRLAGAVISSVRARRDHAEEKVRAVVLQRATEHLLVDRDGRCTLDIAESVNSGTDAEVADTLDVDVRALVLTAAAILSVLDGDLGKANADGTDIAAQDVASVEGLAGPHGIVQTLEVDCKSVSTTEDLT